MTHIAALRDASVASGYRGVAFFKDSKRNPFRAQQRIAPGGGGGTHWFGPLRPTAEIAAQDYADFIDGNNIAAPLPAYPKPTVDMGNPRARRPRTPSIEIVRNEYTGPTDLYDVLVYDGKTGDVLRRKVGVTARGEKRYADICTTFGFSIKPVRPAVTYKTKALALSAETALVAEVAGDPNWRRVGKEAFAPVHPMTTEVRA